MAADLHKEAKTFGVAEDKSGNKEDSYGRIYSRRRTVDWKNETAKSQTEWLFGLRSSEENYVWAGQQGGLDVFRRTHKTSFNGFRTKTAEYHPNKGKKSERRSYLGGLYKSGVEYDTDGEVLGTSQSNPVSAVRVSRTPDGRSVTHEQEDFGGWHYNRREALVHPNGTVEKWRTMERHVGSYSMKVVPDKDGKGETKTRGFGNLFGKNWLFKHSVHYNFETGLKTVEYSGLFNLRRRTKERPMTEKELQKAETRRDLRENIDNTWRRHAAGMHGPQRDSLAGRDPSEVFAEGLQERGALKADSPSRLNDWLNGSQMPITSGQKASRGRTKGRLSETTRHDSVDSDTIALGESATEKGIEESFTPAKYDPNSSIEGSYASEKDIRTPGDWEHNSSIAGSAMPSGQSDLGLENLGSRQQSPPPVSSGYSYATARGVLGRSASKSSIADSTISARHSDMGSESLSMPEKSVLAAKSSSDVISNKADSRSTDADDRVRKAMQDFKLTERRSGPAPSIAATPRTANAPQRQPARAQSRVVLQSQNGDHDSSDENDRVRDAMRRFQMPSSAKIQTRGLEGTYAPPIGYSPQRLQNTASSRDSLNINPSAKPVRQSRPSIDERDDRSRASSRIH